MYKTTFFLLVVVASGAAQGFRVTDNVDIEANKGDNFCQGCKSIVSYVHKYNSTRARAEYKNLFKGFCEFYYPKSTDYQEGPCPVFIEALYYVLGRIDPVNHCDEIGACSADVGKFSPVLSFSPQNEKGVFCQTCEQVINQLKEMLESPKFEAQLKQQVRELCEYLKVIGQDKECQQYLLQYVDQAIDFIRTISPSQYCQSIQLCDKKQQSLILNQFISSVSPKMPALTDFSDFGIETSVKVDEVITKNIDSTRTRSPKCAFCKTFVKEMFKFLKDKRTEETVRDGLDRICKLVYRDQNKLEQCENLVATYSKQFVELLVDETDPELICMIIDECVYPEFKTPEEFLPSIPIVPIRATPPPVSALTMKADPISMSQFISMLDDQVKVGSLRSCVECKLFIKYLQDAVRDPKSQEQVKEWLIENLCDKLGEEDLKNSCHRMVDVNSKAFFEAIVNQLNPQVTCAEVGACKNKGRNILTVDASSPFFGYQQPAEKQKDTPKATLEMAQDLHPLFDPITALFHVRATDACDQCIDLVIRFDEYLATHSFDHDVESLVQNICGNIPSEKAEKSCSDFVRKYGQIIIHAIENMDSPRQLCSRIMLC